MCLCKLMGPVAYDTEEASLLRVAWQQKVMVSDLFMHDVCTQNA